MEVRLLGSIIGTFGTAECALPDEPADGREDVDTRGDGEEGTFRRVGTATIGPFTFPSGEEGEDWISA